MFPQNFRRASRACVSCHQRKLRCDASFRGCPCTRCLQDGKETCILREKLPRFSRNYYPNSQASFYSSERRPTPDQGRVDDGRNKDPTPAGSVEFSRYPFLEVNNLQSLDKDDVAYLRSKGCLNVPDQPILDEFVNQYFLFVHPESPVLDEAKFWRVYLQPDNGVPGLNQKISLFVFQAMLFMASSYVSLESIRKCGFESKEAARDSFYSRAKLLFDLKAETEPSNKAQGAVLLSHQVSPDDPQTGSLWLVYATQNTVIMGQQPVSFSSDVKDPMKKRLWWSILIRDRCLCLGLRRRTQITSKHFNAERSYLEEADFADEIANSHVYNVDSKRLLFETLQQQCRLAVLVTEMATFMFTTNGVSSPSLSFKAFQDHRCEIKRLKNELIQWKKKFCPPQTVPSGSTIQPSVLMFIKMTYMYYYSAQVNLAHYEALIVESHSKFAGKGYINQLCECGTYLNDAVVGLSETMEYFSDSRNVETIPLCTLAFVATPLVVSALDTKLARSYDEMVIRRQRVDLLADIYRRLAMLYDVTNFVAIGTNQILKLVYNISRELCFLEQQAQKSTTDNTSSRPIKDTVSAENSQKLPPRKLLTNWLDLFLCYPRSYLLISTSVDYSLSVGRLPHDNDIPEFLRIAQSENLKFKLPWTNGSDLANPPDSSEGDFWCPSNCPSAGRLSVLQPQANAVNASGMHEATLGMNNFNNPSQVPAVPGGPWSGAPGYPGAYNLSAMPKELNRGPINLDFLNTVSPTTISLWQSSTYQTAGFERYKQTDISANTLLESGMGTGEYGEVYMRDDGSSPDLWLLDCLDETTSNGPPVFNPLTYRLPENDQIDINETMS